MPRATERSPVIREAFTLIELLIVVAIIALLVAILVPTLERAKDRAKTVVCLSNQHQIYLGYALYANSYNGYVIPSYFIAGYNENNVPFRRTWAYRLADFIPSVKADPQVGKTGSGEPPPLRKTILHCPSEPRHGGPVFREGYDYEIYANIREDYAPNVLRCGRLDYSPPYSLGGPTSFYTLKVKNLDPSIPRQTYIGKVSRTFLLAEGNYMDLEPSHSAVENQYGMMYRHGGRRTINMVFFDGHAQERIYPVGVNQYPENPWSNFMPLEAPW